MTQMHIIFLYLGKSDGLQLPNNHPLFGTLRYALQVQYANGKPAALNSLAGSLQVDSRSGDIWLKDFQGDAGQQEAGNLLLRVAVEERKEIDSNNDDGLSPLGGRARLRLETPLISVVELKDDG